MSNVEKLNDIIEEIEKNLTEEIDYTKLSKIIGTSRYTLERIFCFVTGITLTDYIRKRRLSKAAEELQSSDQKIIDIAVKYGYTSPISFSKAFFKMHQILPSNARSQNISLKAFPKLIFQDTPNHMGELDYKIIDLEEQIFYGKATGIIEEEDQISIKNLWDECMQDGTLEYIKSCSKDEELYYGAAEFIEVDKIRYYILGKEKKEGFQSLKIPKATWACFKLNSKEQKDIIDLIEIIFLKWLPSSSYHMILPYPNLEIYHDKSCFYCIPISK